MSESGSGSGGGVGPGAPCRLPVPDLRLSLGGANVCGDPKKATVECSDILVKFGEVEIDLKLELGYNQLNNSMKLTAFNKGTSFKFKYDAPKYLAGALVQLHDYYAETPMIVKPEVVERKSTTTRRGEKIDVKFFKLTPWEFFGATPGNAKSGFDFGSTILNKGMTRPWDKTVSMGGLGDLLGTYNPENPFLSGGLRQGYLLEAQQLIDRLKEREKDSEKYLETQAIHYVDYTGKMRALYTMAAAGELPYDSMTRKYRISEDGEGYQTNVKIVFNLYFKVIRGEFVSDGDSFLSEIKLRGVDFAESGVSHKKKDCLRAVVVLNEEDGSENRKGVYFFGLAWGKSNPVETFLEPVRRAEPAHGHGAGPGKASGKTIATPYFESLVTKPREGETTGDYLMDDVLRGKFVVLEDDLNPWNKKVISAMEKMQFIREERNWSLAAAAAPPNKIPNTIIWNSIWRSQNDVKPTIAAYPTVNKKPSSGWEITSGFVVYFTAGQNVTNGDIRGSAAQCQILLPLETFAILGDDSLTFETLPGALWNIMSSAVFVVKIDVVQGVKDCYTIVNWYNAQLEMKRQIEAMKRYVEEIRSKMHKGAEQLTEAFKAQDIDKYNKVLEEMKALAADFAQKTGQQIDLTAAIQGGPKLQAYIDAKNKLQNEINNASGITQISEAGGGYISSLPEPAPIHPPSVSINEVLDSIQNGTDPSQILVIPVPKGEPAGVNPLSQNPPSTANPVDPVALAPALDTPSVGSTYLLDNIGFPDGSTSNGTLFGIPGVDEGLSGNEPWIDWQK